MLCYGIGDEDVRETVMCTKKMDEEIGQSAVIA